MNKGYQVGFEVSCPDFIKLQKVFQDMAYADQKRIINAALRKAVTPTLKQAQANVTVGTGNLRRSLGIIASKNGIGVIVAARRGGGYKGYHGYLVEEGTKMRYYTPKKTQRHPIMIDGMVAGFVTEKAGVQYKRGQMKKGGYYTRYLRRAANATDKQAYNIMVDEWNKGIERYHKKHGLK